MNKPVIVCSEVGDFDQYIVHQKNGFLVKVNDESAQFENYIRWVYENPVESQKIGASLHRTVVEEFSASEKAILKYLAKA